MTSSNMISEFDSGGIDPSDIELWKSGRIWPLLEKLRRDAPVHFCDDSRYGPYWSVTRHADILTVETRHDVFSSASEYGGVVIHDDIAVKFANSTLESLITMDPPRHERHRNAVSGVVGPKNLAHFSEIIRERTSALLDSLPINEMFDWVPTVAVELTTQMLATLFAFPFEDRGKLTRWSNVATSEPGQGIVANEKERIREVKECLFYFTRLWRERRGNQSGFDFVSMLAQNSTTREMSPMNYLGNILVLIVGGNDTTRNSMSGAINAFHRFPIEFDKLRKKPELIDNTVAEIIRWQTPIAHMRRTALADFNLNGANIKKGDKVVMWYASGNRDESVFEGAAEFNIERENARRHLSFGFGIHRCMGRRLAELQLKILLEEMLKRWSRVELTGDPERTPSNFVHGFTKMPVRIIT